MSLKKEIGLMKNDQNAGFSEILFNKKIGYVLFFSSILSIISAIVVINGFVSAQNQKISEINNACQNLEIKVKGVLDSIAEMDKSVGSLKDEVKSTKDSFVRIYTSLAAIQKDISIMKKEFHIDDIKNMDDAIKKLSSEKYDFIVSLENFVNEGTPFEDFLESYDEKIDLKKYSTFGELLKFKSNKIKSVSDLKKDIISIGNMLFNISFEESFFERQKRIIKEKIINAIKIRKIDEESAKAIESDNVEDKKLYETAVNAISDGDLEKAADVLENIKIDSKELSSLISDINKRRALNKGFELFKNEFVELENQN